MDVSILIVSWNVRELLRRCLQSVASQQSSLSTDDRRLATEIIVVDNASRDDTVAMLRDEFPRVRVIANTENLGFTRANNQALALAQGRYLFLLNPDTELRPGALQTLYEYAEQNPRVGIIGPQLFYGDGAVQSSRRRFPTLATAFLESTLLQQWFPRNRVLARYYMLDTRDDATQQVDWINGAAMFVRRQVYEQIGGLDEAFFMYSEELDWCYRAKKAVWQIVYLPTAQIAHYEGKSSEQAVAARDIHFNTSKIRYWRKYRGAFFAEILRVFLLATFAFQIARESVKWVLGHKRALRAQRVKAYWQVLKSRLVRAN
ncbi:MAG: glycosyltransferase family 2 protein [Chloroflexi bacterium]|nr:glycosyltransferase family 2 protein [Chloroflexota bacterium]